jgi:hypothetical protein
MLRLSLAVSLLVLTASAIRAQDEKQKPAPEFKAPVPKVMPMPLTTEVVVVPYQRSDTREVWQHYAPNRFGRMVPRVIVTPYGALYSRTLEPYQLGGSNPREYLPITVD